MVPYWSLEMFFISTWMFGFFLFHRATTWSMPGTVFQYWRVTLPFAGSQDAAAGGASPTESGDEHAASTAMPAAAVKTAPARRMRVTVLLMFSFQTTTGDGARPVELTPQAGGFGDAFRWASTRTQRCRFQHRAQWRELANHVFIIARNTL